MSALGATSQTRTFAVRVMGTPAPQGSKAFMGLTPNGKPKMKESSAKVKPWRNEVIQAARLEKMRRQGFTPMMGPLTAAMVFYMTRPKSLHRSIIWPATRPDLSKLIRSTEDALTEAQIWGDDGQVVIYREVSEQYATAEDPPGAFIYVETMPNEKAS